MTIRQAWLIRAVVLVLDCIGFELSFYFTYFARFHTGLFANPITFAAPELLIPSIVVTTYWAILNVWFGLYRYDPLQPRRHIARDALRVTGFGVLILFILTFDPNRPLPESRVILAGYGIGIYLIIAGDRIALSTILRFLRLRGIGTASTLLIGNGQKAREVLAYVCSHPEIGFRVTSYLGNCADLSVNSIAWKGRFSTLPKWVASREFDVVLFGLEPENSLKLGRMVKFMRQARVRTFVQADQYPILVGEVRPAHVYGHPLVEVRSELLSPAERGLKRLTDVAIALGLLLLTLPIWIALTILIPLDSPGPVFYTQSRVGRGGKEFTLLKFRSMYRDAEAGSGAVLAQERDPRVTRTGRFLRATRLDELPQLLNVLRGQMSVVGPRPERREFVEHFVRDIPLYERRLNVKPGITGWSQVHLKYDSRADQIPIKLKYDFYYIENMSLPLDMKILFMTLFVILRGEGL